MVSFGVHSWILAYKVCSIWWAFPSSNSTNLNDRCIHSRSISNLLEIANHVDSQLKFQNRCCKAKVRRSKRILCLSVIDRIHPNVFTIESKMVVYIYFCEHIAQSHHNMSFWVPIHTYKPCHIPLKYGVPHPWCNWETRENTGMQNWVLTILVRAPFL